jgi:tRNA threonylcarbamoyladenosine biosynthesis protein TsaE
VNFPIKKILYDENETAKFCGQFAGYLKEGGIVSLVGDLGTGKTFLVQKICEAFKINDVTSPTFSIVNEYRGDKKIYHFDFYRIKKINELYDIGIDEYFNDSQAITFIEWADMFEEILPKERINIEINYINETKREIKIDKNEQ